MVSKIRTGALLWGTPPSTIALSECDFPTVTVTFCFLFIKEDLTQLRTFPVMCLTRTKRRWDRMGVGSWEVCLCA